MRQRKPDRTTVVNDEMGVPGGQQSDRLRRVLLSGMMALFVASPLVPSEAAADLGSGIPLVLLWLVVAFIWLAAALFRGGLVARFEPVGTVVMLLVGWLAISTTVMASYGTPRPSINVVWEWIAFVVGYRMCLQLVHSAAERRAIIVVMVSLAVGLSAYGLYQYAVILPKQSEAYRRATPEEQAAVREAAGILAPEGSPQVEHFVQRINSREPSATFGLANSLAGFLLPWFVVLVGMTMDSFLNRSSNGYIRLAGVLGIVFIVGCLLLTKSRAAWLAALLAVAIVLFRARRRINPRVIVIVGFLLGLVVAVIFTIGGIDWEVISEAPKSLGYRIEYWRATVGLIADNFWFGCGPGNFQDYYLQYKLPQASEEIKDPHNFILEVWAIGGTPAVVLLGAVLLIFFFYVVRPIGSRRDVDKRQVLEEHAHTEVTTISRLTNESDVRNIYTGGVCGMILGLILTWMAGFWPRDFLLTGGPSAVIFAGLFYRWARDGAIYPWVMVVGVCAALFNWLFAGGIGYPGVAGSVWLLMALVMMVSIDFHAWITVPLLRVKVSVGLMFLLLVACYLTAYQPVLMGTDRWDPRPWQEQASQYFQQWLVDRNEAVFSAFEESLTESLRLDARSVQLRRQAALFYLWVADIKNDDMYVGKATEYLRRASRWYPSNAMVHAEYAWSLDLAGDTQRAAEEAMESLRLDALNPHQELKLHNRRLFDEPEVNQFASGIRLTPIGKTAEHCMLQLRSTGVP